jgi:hypothetical protein
VDARNRFYSHTQGVLEAEKFVFVGLEFRVSFHVNFLTESEKWDAYMFFESVGIED